jgi:chloramphenicol-sensitive protein RarD
MSPTVGRYPVDGGQNPFAEPAAGSVPYAPVSAPDRATRTVQRGVQLGVTAYLLWGFLTIYWKQLSTFDAFELIAWRMGCAGVVMAVIVTARRTWPNIVVALRHGPTARRLVMASVLLTVNWGCYVWAVTNDRVIETALGYFIAPLATMAIGVFVLHEEPTKAQRVAFALAAVAVVILTVSYGRPPWIALLIAASWSLYGLAKRRVPLGAVDSLAGETFVLFVPAVLAVLAFSTGADSVAKTADAVDWVLVLGTGVVTAVPLMLFAAAAQSIPFTLLGPLNLLVPIINFGLGWLLYGEEVPLDRLVGFAVVWVALLVVMWDRVTTHRRPPVPEPVA